VKNQDFSQSELFTIHFANIVPAAQSLQVLKKGMVIYMNELGLLHEIKIIWI